MIPYSGDYKEDSTVCIMFNTFSSDDPSASCTITNFVNTDVHIHKDDGLAQRNNAAGITVSVDFDGITGSHMIKIDTNDNTVAGFWVTGKDYFVRIEGTTVDGGTVNAVVGRFSIENRFNEVDVIKWLGQACAAVTVNGVPEVDITHLLGTAWLAPGVAGTPDVNAKQLGGTTQTGRDVGANVLLSSGSGAGQLDFTSGVVKSNLAQILGTALTETAGWLAAGFKKLFNVATPVLVASDVMRGTDGANTTVPDAAGVAATPAEVATALTDINLDHLCKTATAGADMTTEVVDNSILSRILSNGDTSVFDPSTDGLQLIRDRGDAAWVTGAGGSDRLLMVDTTIATLASQTSFTLTTGSIDDDAYNNCTIVIEDASTATQKAVGIISNYVGATKTVTLKYDPAIFTIATTDKVYILAENALKSTLANRQLNVAADGDIAGNVDGSVASVVGHTVQTGDSYAIVNSGMHGNSALKSLIDTVDGVVDSILADTGTDGVVVASASKTGYALSATGANLILKDSMFALAIADAVWDEIITGATHGIATSAGKRLLQLAAFAIHDGTAQAGAATTITLAVAANGGDGVYNRNLISISAGTGVGQTRTIVDYNGTTKVCVIDREWRINPDATSEYQILADDTPLVSDHGVAQGGTATTITLRNYASATNDIYLCNIVIIVAGVGRGQARLVGSYNGTTKVATICGDNWITTPDTTSVYVMIPYGASCACCICDYALGQINAECDTALTDYDPPTRTEATADKDAIITEVDANETKIDLLQTDSTAIKAKTDNLPSGISKNVLLNNFEFLMVLSSDHISPATGKTIDCQRSIDGAAFANCNSATATEVSAGIYKLNLAASDLNGDVITLKFSEASCDTTIITIKTES